MLAGCAERHAALGQGKDIDDARLDAATFRTVGSVSKRFISYNVEMLELTGGRFWKPYGSEPSEKPELFEYRPPIDLQNSRLRALARGLAPAYVRYSGTWANATVLAEDDQPSPSAPGGYDGVLTREQWRRAVEFARVSDAEIVTSMPTSVGSRNADGTWRPDDAERLFAYTSSLGGRIAATEFANEPNLIGGTKPPAGYDAAAYRRDFGIFATWVRSRSQGTLVLGPGAFELGEGSAFPPFIKKLPTFEVASAGAGRPDVVSFHFYGALSQRCNGTKDIDRTSDTWLSKIDRAIADTRLVGDVINPSAPLWLTETGESACGGNPDAKTFADTFRYVDQLARSALQGVQVVMHNTLAASDYALLDDRSFLPRPNYWAAYLWKRTMGETVLDSRRAGIASDMWIYAHCQRGVSGGVTFLAINPDPGASRTLRVKGRADVFSLTQVESQPGNAALNGKELQLGDGDTLPPLIARQQRDAITVPRASINFITVPGAGNPSCMF
ncbi:hypothetical protein NRB_04940 [Novosphingobium sp. 11B]